MIGKSEERNGLPPTTRSDDDDDDFKLTVKEYCACSNAATRNLTKRMMHLNHA